MFNFMRRKFSNSAPLPMMFIVGTGSKHDNLELRYALRSVAKFGRGISRMIVAETLAPSDAAPRPDGDGLRAGAASALPWLSPTVEHILIEPFTDLRGRNRNITLTVIEGVKRAGLTGDFILGIDDVFLTRPTDFATLPIYAGAQHLPTQNPTGGSWGEAMVDCGKWLRAHGYPDVNFMTHAHIRMNADVILRHYDELRRTATTTETVRGLDILSLVGNMALADATAISSASQLADATPPADSPASASQLAAKKAVAIRADFKLTRFDLTGVTDCFSIADKIFEDPDFVTYLSNAYPQPSPWEKTESADRPDNS